MGIFSTLFGSKKVIETGMEMADEAFFTDQEKSAAKQDLLKRYEPFKLAQRYLSLVFCIPYALAWVITYFASFFISVETQMLLLTEGDMGKIVLAIVGFYFLGGVVSGGLKK